MQGGGTESHNSREREREREREGRGAVEREGGRENGKKGEDWEVRSWLYQSIG